MDGFNVLWYKASRVKRLFSPLVVDPIMSMFLWSIVTLQPSMCVLTGPLDKCSEKLFLKILTAKVLTMERRWCNAHA